MLYCEDFARKLFETKTLNGFYALDVAETRMNTDDEQNTGEGVPLKKIPHRAKIRSQRVGKVSGAEYLAEKISTVLYPVSLCALCVDDFALARNLRQQGLL